jgi:hypothetical protein
MRYLVLKSKDEHVFDEVRLNGVEPTMEREDPEVLVVELPEDDQDANLKIGSEEQGYQLLRAELIDRYAAPTPAAAQPLQISAIGIPQPSTTVRYMPRQSTFIPRIGPDDVKPLDDPFVAGTPDGTGMPINYVDGKTTEIYLVPDKPLGADEYAFGQLRQLDTHWEPLGWALDEWINTTSLAPFEDTVESDLNVASSRGREEVAGAEESDDVRERAAGITSATEAMQLATTAEQSSRDWRATIGGPPEAASTQPLAALARQFIGNVQVNFGRTRTASSGALDADLSNQVISHLEQATTKDRLTSNRALESTVNAWAESRRLRALRNLGPGQSVNLALFSVVRQWLVSAVEESRTRVVFIRAYQIEKAFEYRDLFEHRAVLSDGLLDPKLRDGLEKAAEAYEPSPPPAVDQETEPGATAERVAGKLVITDPAEGHGSTIRMSAVFESDGHERSFSTDVEASQRGTFDFEIALEDQPLSHLTGWVFEFVNPGRLDLDATAVFTPADLEIYIAGNQTVNVEIPGSINLASDKPETYPRGFSLDSAESPDHDTPPKVRRILDHLNANRPYYRLLIDYYTDPVTRFVRLAERQLQPPEMPADLEPVGVAGAHLAFALNESTPPPPNEKQLPVRTLLSTPAGGTFVEVLQGSNEIDPAPETKGWPTVALPEKSTLPWPTPIELTAVDGAKQENSQAAAQSSASAAEQENSGAESQATAAQATTQSQLLTKIPEIMKALGALHSALKALPQTAEGDAEDTQDPVETQKTGGGAADAQDGAETQTGGSGAAKAQD